VHTLTLEDLNGDTGLVVSICREDLRLLRRDGRVTFDKQRHDTTSALDRCQGKERSDIEKDFGDLLGGVTREDSSLNGRAVGDSLIRVNRLVRLLAVEEVRNEPDNTGDTSGATDEDDLVNLRLVDLCITEDLLDRLASDVEEVLAEFLERAWVREV
jgi:hypothetical protein